MTPPLAPFIEQHLLLVTLAIVSGGALIFTGMRGRDPGALSTTEATLLMNREHARVLDVREDAEFAAGHLPDALHIPLGALSERAGELKKLKNKPIIICCASGPRAARAANELRQQGFERVHTLQGGISEWEKAGLPLAKTA